MAQVSPTCRWFQAVQPGGLDGVRLGLGSGPACRDMRGAVYVEFIFAFVPLFVLFLAICQLSLIAVAELVVEHAATAGARSAIVVLEDNPENFDDAPRGSLSQGSPQGVGKLSGVLGDPGLAALGAGQDQPTQQRGARMEPIRSAAMFPLLALSGARAGSTSVAGSLASGSDAQLVKSLAYVVFMSSVSVHDQAETQDPASDPIAPNASVTVRVRYAFQCTVPVVRQLLCVSLESLWRANFQGGTAKQFGLSVPDRLPPSVVAPDAHFYVLHSKATLPNQGAAYYGR